MTVPEINTVIISLTGTVVTLLGVWMASKLGAILDQIHTTNGDLTQVRAELAAALNALAAMSGGTHELQAIVRYLVPQKPDFPCDTVPHPAGREQGAP